ncbi:MAG: hypothetical protein E6G68_10480 [Actinobacteria bacterium]|nr:MAG: hypothetical protein E6G68_10480 [Actinomycetota bacterium]
MFPPLDASALTSEGIQFQRGRRSFFYDVFGLFRENLIALTGLFGLLHDAFANLAIPILGPDKGNRESGSFDKPNQLWALWTLAKGLEQADRALNVIQNAVELSRDATKGELATLQQLRLFVGFSSDPAIASVLTQNLSDLSANALLFNSIWSDLKSVAEGCGAVSGFPAAQTPYFPDAPAIVTPLCPAAAVPLNLAYLKLGIVEHDLHAIQKENHVLDTANLAGLAPLPLAPGACGGDVNTPAGQTCGSYDKYNFIKFPFGMEELERGLYTLKTKGFDPLQAALGNKDTPNSFIWAMHILTQGAEFGVETARNTLQWDINAIDISTAQKAAAVQRAKDMATFMGRPMDPDKKPAIGQLVLTFSTGSVTEHPRATDSPFGKFSVLLACAGILTVLFGFARFRWFIV